jgi:hypothetical protein
MRYRYLRDQKEGDTRSDADFLVETAAADRRLSVRALDFSLPLLTVPDCTG